MSIKKISLSGALLLLTSLLFAKTVKVACFESSNYMHQGSDVIPPTGYAIEYIEAIVRYTDWKIEYVNGNWSELYNKTKTGEVDLMPGISITPERSKYLFFPDQAMGSEAFFIYKSRKSSNISARDVTTLKDKRIGSIKGTILFSSLQEWVDKSKLNCIIYAYDDSKSIMQALENGVIDAICDTDINVKANSDLVPLFQIGSSNSYLAVSKESPALLEELNAAIREINTVSPAYISSLQSKYFGNSAVSAAFSNYSSTRGERIHNVIQENIDIVFNLLVTIILLLIILFFIYYRLQKRAKEAENKSIEAIQKHIEILQSLADTYFSTHLFDLPSDTFQIIKSNSELAPLEFQEQAAKSIHDIMIERTSEPFLENVLAFVDLKTLPERLKDKKSITTEFIGKFKGWCRISFITVTADHNGYPIKVLYTVKVIEEEKRNEERLRKLSRTDGLTGLENRNSYELTIKLLSNDVDYSRVIFAMDLDGLKITNDTLGHDAGDEIIVGVANILRKVFGDKAKCFRIGGDEFCVITSAEKPEIDKYCSELNKLSNEWKGVKANSLHISYGYVSTYEYPDYTLLDLVKIADNRMYSMKRDYYTSLEPDRRKI